MLSFVVYENIGRYPYNSVSRASIVYRIVELMRHRMLLINK